MSGDGIAVNLLALYANSVTRLGDILNVWVTNFLSKLAQIWLVAFKVILKNIIMITIIIMILHI